MKQVYLLTGMKGRAGGFYTEEIRSREVREGFKLVTLDGQSAILAHTDIHSQYRVSKYGIDIDVLDRIGVSALYQAAEECDLIVVDEIGKMELFSANFRKAVLHIIDSGKKVLGTIMLSPNPWADSIKRQPQVNLVSVTRANYHQVLEGLQHWLKGADEGKGEAENNS